MQDHNEDEKTDKPDLGLPRYLAPIGQPRDYTTVPALSVREEPECVSDAIVDSYAAVATFHRSQQHALDVAAAEAIRPMLRAEDRIKDIHRRAKHGHVDLSHEIMIMNRDIARARERDQPVPQRTLNRLTNIEGLLDHGMAA